MRWTGGAKPCTGRSDEWEVEAGSGAGSKGKPAGDTATVSIDGRSTLLVLSTDVSGRLDAPMEEGKGRAVSCPWGRMPTKFKDQRHCGVVVLDCELKRVRKRSNELMDG